MGVGKDGEPTENFQLGMELHAKYTVFAEGARGHLGKQLITKYKLDAGRDPQTYGIGIKEVWEIDPSRHTPGFVMHTAGWPMNNDTYGGAFMYHMEDNKIAIGYVVGLDYANPWLSPFEEFQRWKTHNNIKWYFTNYKGEVNASFVGFVPSRQPALTILVVIDTPRGPNPAYGGAVAAPGRRSPWCLPSWSISRSCSGPWWQETTPDMC
jgi:electron-transferring-flavoprotein dehydrogenase